MLDVQLAVDRALNFVRGLNHLQFEVDPKTKWAVYKQIVIIGEAAGRVAPNFQAEHSEIPWSEMISMRHRLVHGYDSIKWNLVWQTAVDDLPRPLAVLTPLIPQEEPPKRERIE